MQVVLIELSGLVSYQGVRMRYVAFCGASFIILLYLYYKYEESDRTMQAFRTRGIFGQIS